MIKQRLNEINNFNTLTHSIVFDAAYQSLEKNNNNKKIPSFITKLEINP